MAAANAGVARDCLVVQYVAAVLFYGVDRDRAGTVPLWCIIQCIYARLAETPLN